MKKLSLLSGAGKRREKAFLIDGSCFSLIVCSD